jgi:predicted outer membrane protein
MLRLKVSADISLENLDSQLQQRVQEKKDALHNLPQVFDKSGIEFESCEVFYGRESQSG